MNMIYIVGLISILALFIWKKYTSHTKRRNQYIKYLQEQNQKLQSVIQEEPDASQSMPSSTNNLSSSESIIPDAAQASGENYIPIQEEEVLGSGLPTSGRVMGIPPELAFMLNQFPGQMNQAEPQVNIEEVKEDFVDMNDVIEDSDDDIELVDDCVESEFETKEDPEKIPLDNAKPEDCKDEGKCCLKPLLEDNFADVPEELYDVPSIRVSENDDSGIKASNTDDNRKYLSKDEELEEALDDLIQTKQMHCSAVLSTGKNKGSMCGKKTKRDGLCKVHSK